MIDNALNRIEFEVASFEENLKGKEKRQERRKKIGEKLKKVASKLSPADAIFLPLLPFKLALQRYLEKKGVKPEKKNIASIAKAFYEYEIKGKKGSLEENLIDDVANVAGELVKAVITWLKKRKDLKNEGKTNADEDALLLDADDAAAAADNATEAEILQAAKESFDTKNSTGGMDPKNMLIIAGVVVAVYFFSKR